MSLPEVAATAVTHVRDMEREFPALFGAQPLGASPQRELGGEQRFL